MIVLNECRVSHDGKALIVEATVENLSYYKSVYIDSVVVDTQKTFLNSGPSNNPVFIKQFTSDYPQVDVLDDCGSLRTDEECKCGNIYTSKKKGHKNIKLYISAEDMKLSNLNDDIFFVYVVATGVPAACTPCGMDNQYTMGVAVNMRPIYNKAMSFIRELDKDCATPRGFVDMILRLKAFELSLKTGNYPIAFKQWEKLFKEKVTITPRNCGCNGTY